MIFGQGFIRWEGTLLGENVSFTTALERPGVDVFSVTGNYEGQAVGPYVRMAEFELAIPAKRSAINYEKLLWEGAKGELSIEEATSGTSFFSYGEIVSCTRSGGVGQTFRMSVVFRGKPSPFDV